MNAMATLDTASNHAAPPRRRSWLTWWLRGVFAFAALLVLMLLVLTALVTLAAPQLWQSLGQQVHLTIDGQAIEFGQMGLAHALAVGAAVALAVTLVLAVVCTVVPMALLVAGGAVFFGLAVALLALAGAATVALSPLLLLAALVWLLWRLVKR
jgi:hypothetical protein